MLDKLNFGKDDAESEKMALQKVFLPTSLFGRILDDRKWLILGRKGAGKTAICLSLFQKLQDEKAKVSLISPENLSAQAASTLSKESLDDHESSSLAWRHCFLTEIGKYAIASVQEKLGKNFIRWPDEAKQIRTFLARNESRYRNVLDKILKVVGGVKSISLKIGSLEAGADSESGVRSVSYVRDSLDDVTESMAYCIDRFVKEPIYVFVDRVDELWGPNSDSTGLIVGLVEAAKYIRANVNSSRIVIFLRSDIFDSLTFHDSDKFHSDEERIIWDKESLFRLINKRINFSLKRAIDENKSWGEIFVHTIDREDSFDYLVKHTLMRPRDLIQLCNCCRDSAQDMHLEKISKEAINKALLPYSNWKLNDLRDEYHAQFPFLERLFWGIFAYGPHRFDRNVLNDRLAPHLSSLTGEFGLDVFEPIDNLLSTLFNIGFIGALKSGKIIYFYQGGQVVIPFISEFVVHPAFRAGLQTFDSFEHLKGIQVINKNKGQNKQTAKLNSDARDNSVIGNDPTGGRESKPKPPPPRPSPPG